MAGLIGAAITLPVIHMDEALETTLGTCNFFSTVRYGTFQAAMTAGEANTEPGQVFVVDDGNGSLIYFEKTAVGSIEIGRTISSALLETLGEAENISYTKSGPFYKKRSVSDFIDQQPFFDDWIGGNDEVRIQRAINDVAASGGGTIKCRQDASQAWQIGDFITVKTGVTIDWGPGPAGKAGYPGDVRKLIIAAGENKPDENVVTMERNSKWIGGAFKQDFQPLDEGKRLIEAAWIFGTDGQPSGADFININDVNLGACWGGVNMDNGGGWVLNVRGQPLFGLRVDRMLGTSVIEHLEWWDYSVLEKDNEELHRWMLNESIGLDLYRADDLVGNNIFAWNVGKVIRSRASTSIDGSLWAHFSNVRADFCNSLLDVEDVNILQISNAFITQRNANVSKSLGILRETAKKGCVQIGNLQAHNTSQAFVVENGCGVEFQIGNLHPRRNASLSNGNVQHALVINEGWTSKIKLSNAEYEDISGPVFIGNAKPFTLGDDITPTDFGNASGWRHDGVKQDGKDIAFRLNQVLGAASFVPSDRMRQEKLCIISCKLKTIGIENVGSAQHYLRIHDGNVLNDMIIPGFTGFNPIYGDGDDRDSYRTYIKIIELRNSSDILEWVFGGASGPCKILVRDLSVFAVDPRKLDRRMLEWLQANQPNGNGHLPAVDISRGRRILSLTSAPTAGVYWEGEEWRRTPQVAGCPVGGRCTIGGSPGTWIDLPVL